MKIAVTATGKDPTSQVEPRFGRAPMFLVYDTETETWEALDNQVNLQAAQGAGIQAAQQVVRSGATVLLSGHCGPRAHSVLQAAGVAIYTAVEGTVEEAVRLYRQGALTQATGPDVQSHW
jgi:predicted Fe-Mo cluster-binding NifX family protein